MSLTYNALNLISRALLGDCTGSDSPKLVGSPEGANLKTSIYFFLLSQRKVKQRGHFYPWNRRISPPSGVGLRFQQWWARNAVDNQLFTEISCCHQFFPPQILWRQRWYINVMRLRGQGFDQLCIMRKRSINWDDLYYWPFATHLLGNDTDAAVD